MHTYCTCGIKHYINKDMKTLKSNVYTLEMLGEVAKRNAILTYRQSISKETAWANDILEEFKEPSIFLGFSLQSVLFSTFGNDNDGVAFVGEWQAKNVQSDRIKIYTNNDNYLHQLGTYFKEISHNYPKSSFIMKRHTHSSTSYDSVLFDIKNDGSTVNSRLSGWVRAYSIEAMKYLYQRLYNENNFRNNEEVISEEILENELLFDLSGNRLK